MSSTDKHRQQDLRVVILGKTGAGKSASGNTLLGASSFSCRLSPSPATRQCEAHTLPLGGRRITVVDTPGLTAEKSSDTDQEKLLQCLQLAAPGPHVFLLVIPLGRFTQEEQDTVARAEELFGSKLFEFTIILFTFVDSLKTTSLEEYISNAGENLQQLVNKCGNRYHAFNNNIPDEDDQANRLLVSIDKLLAARGNERYTSTDSKNEDEVRQQHSENKHMDVDYSRDGITDVAGHDNVDEKSEDGSVNVPDLICRLNLNSFYPHQLTVADALNISCTSFKTAEPQSEQSLKNKDLAFVYLQKLFTLDYRARSIISTTECATSEIMDKFEENDNFDDFLKEETEFHNCDEDINSQIHPMDLQMAVFHCADSFLKQNMVSKLSSCQYALPLLVPSPTSADIEFPLWTFREIKKTWKSCKTFSTTLPVCHVKAPMVFFCRLGSVTTSKSSLLNSLINPKHDTFFHRNSPGSSRSRLFIDGLAEIAWYCPGGNTDDLFNECIAFCNLHGDAVEHRKQTDFLTERSTVNIVLMQNMKLNDEPKKLLEKLHRSSKPLICVVNDLQKGLKVSGNSIRIGLKDTQKAELCKELIGTIKMCLQNCDLHPTFNLEESSHLAKTCGFRVDEDSEDCQEGKNGAQKVMELLKVEDISQIKAKFLPCQGKLWQEWSWKNKQLNRLHGDEQTKSKIRQEMQSIRDEQRKSSVDFITAISKIINCSHTATKMFFVKWLGVYLHASFSEKLSEVTQQYYKQLLKVRLLKQKGEITDDFKEKQEELERSSENVDALTLGLEHIVREMGQIYEAWSTVPEEMGADLSTLPGLAADLLISGHPLELMDGDAAHVPLTWIESVLDKVTDKLGDQKVFVLSVLGLQSSGKSTLLNTMFGLQFAVSAGRCTRGAFMQLIKVKEEAKEELKFDNLLVLDTEGMQSLELVSKNKALTHDNELATFVTGLADLTLINIFGENPAEMQDIIQIVVQAFLRMKKVNLTPSCMFVHQNVTDIIAGEKNMDGRRRLQETLDSMTCLAASLEVCSAEYFTDVIKFDIEEGVYYFSQLWEGNPPMAPPNPCYSEHVVRLKQAILSNAKQNYLRLSELKVRIKDLWTAVLNEDFVFSFKNTLEISAYSKLEVMYWNWTWKLREEMLLIQNRTQYMIDNETGVSIDQNWICKEISNTFHTVKNEMEKFFTEDTDAGFLAQWKMRTEQKIADVHDCLTGLAANKMTELIQLKEARKMLDERKTQYENELFNRSKDLASKLKGKATDEQELEKNFGAMWEKWVLDLTAKIPQISDVSVEQDVINMLSSFYRASTVHSSKQSCFYKNICEKGDYSEYVTMKKERIVFSYSLKNEDNDSIRELVQHTVTEAEEIIRNKPVKKLGYSDAYIQEILNCVNKRVREFKAKTYTLKNEFSVDLSLYICDTAAKEFTMHHKEFRDANDPLIYLEKKKDEFFSIFKKKCEGASATTVFADFVCNKFKPSILQAVYDQAAIDATAEMRSNFPAFSGNRSNLEKHVLLDLAEAENFACVITYIMNPKKHFSNFINKTFKEQMLENSRILQILKNAVKMKKHIVSTAIQKVTQETKQTEGKVNEWIERFSQELTDKMKFTLSDLTGTKSQENMDIVFFGKALDEALQNVIEGMMTKFGNISSVRTEMFRQSPQEILMEQLCGCWVQCPFCAAICTNTIEGHGGEHSVPFHRPEGVNGWKWHKTDNLCVDICTSLVDSNCNIVFSDGRCIPYKTYKKAGPKYACWNITPDTSEQPYWKWIVCRFQKDLEQHYKKTFQGKGKIPEEWRNISKRDAIKSLN